jgi:hypothetical protein
MRIQALRAIAIAMISAVGGCGGVPPLDIPSDLTVAHIIDRIQCEVWKARHKYPRFRNRAWVAVANLTLQVDDSVGLTPKVSFIHPFATEGTNFAFGASATLKGARQRIYVEQIEILVDKVNKGSCDRQRDGFSLTGELGIVETVAIAMSSIDSDDAVQFQPKPDKDAFGQTIQFVVTKNVSDLGPTWTLVRFVGPGGLFGAERVDTHRLIISFAPGAATTKDGAVIMREPAGDRARSLIFQMQLQSQPLAPPVRR